MKDAQKPDHISLNTLLSRLKEGRYVIPDFQREFEWKPWDIKELIRSIFLDYYIGSLLLWKGKKSNFDALSCEPIYGYTGNAKPEYIVLDGQQRLTAMYYAFLAPKIALPNRSSQYVYFVDVNKFMGEVYDEAFNYDFLTRKLSKLLADQTAQFENHIFPMEVIGAGGWDLPNWVQGYEKYWLAKAQDAETAGDLVGLEQASHYATNARAFGEHVRGITEQYQISYIELDQDLEVDKVCDIFTQINSRGVRLDVFDLVNALLKPKGLQLKQMWRNAASRLEFVNNEKMNVYILQVMSILRQGYCSPKYLYFLLPGQEKQVRNIDGTRHKEILIADVHEFEQVWNNAVASLESAIKLLQHPHEFGVTSSQYIPYVAMLPALAALQSHLKTLPHLRQLEAQRKIRHWYWASIFTGRYSGSVESTSARDFFDIKAWIDSEAAEPPLILEFAKRFKNLELRKETKQGTSIYNGIFNLFVIQGARDWISGNIPQSGDLDDHHIVPASWGTKHIKGGLIHSILNRSPLTADTNRNIIRDRLPNVYLRDLIKENGEAQISKILESHFISPVAQAILLRDPFTADDFDAFIAERQRTIQDAIENLLIKERLLLSPQLRELDESIEQVELSIRRVIDTSLDGDNAKMPPHVLQKVDERISRAAKKNAALDISTYQALGSKLEFCDLRELQDVIVGKSLWPIFEPRFVNKDTLANKFDQLAELRNSIRHSRSVSDIVRKEGEAAILWFNAVLNK